MRALAIVVLLLASCDGAPPVVAASEPAPPKTLRALASVNDPDLGNARPYRERHALLDELAATDDAKRIDRRLNLALDLHQAEDAPDPCAAYTTALAQIETRGDAWFAAHVRDAAPPPGCDARNREAVLAQLAPPPPAEPTPVPSDPPPATIEPPTDAKAKKLRKPKPAVAPDKPDAPAAEPTKKPDTGIAAKIDEELKPFGM